MCCRSPNICSTEEQLYPEGRIEAYCALLCCLADSRGVVSKEVAIPDLKLGNLLIPRDYKILQPYCSTCACNLHGPVLSGQCFSNSELSNHSRASDAWPSSMPESCRCRAYITNVALLEEAWQAVCSAPLGIGQLPCQSRTQRRPICSHQIAVLHWCARAHQWM
jgi:hypothetical protein